MSKFKVGDRVEVSNDGLSLFGKQGVITAAPENSAGWVSVVMDDDADGEDMVRSFMEYSLEPVYAKTVDVQDEAVLVLHLTETMLNEAGLQTGKEIPFDAVAGFVTLAQRIVRDYNVKEK